MALSDGEDSATSAAASESQAAASAAH
jgi:hypothetical protein